MTVHPPRWTAEQLEADRLAAIELFRQQRMGEPLEDYLAHFDEVQGTVENLLELTVDLSQLSDAAVDVLTAPDLLEAVRYLAGPPISADDLKVVSDARLSRTALRGDPEMARRVIGTILLGLDRNRFPWVAEDREPTDVKAAVWLSEFGTAQTVPAAMLAGVFKRHNLEQAQDRGLALFWSHDLDQLIAFIERTR